MSFIPRMALILLKTSAFLSQVNWEKLERETQAGNIILAHAREINGLPCEAEMTDRINLADHNIQRHFALKLQRLPGFGHTIEQSTTTHFTNTDPAIFIEAHLKTVCTDGSGFYFGQRRLGLRLFHLIERLTFRLRRLDLGLRLLQRRLDYFISRRRQQQCCTVAGFNR